MCEVVLFGKRTRDVGDRISNEAFLNKSMVGPLQIRPDRPSRSWDHSVPVRVISEWFVEGGYSESGRHFKAHVDLGPSEISL